jgi:hypothetical protein
MPEPSKQIMSTEEFKYFKQCVDKDITFHDEQLAKYNSPEEVLEGYNGRFTKGDDSQIENYLFVSAATVLPSFFYQLPKVNIRSERLPFEASVLTALINATLTDKEKIENQLCIIDAFLPYGYAVMKNGYNSRTGKLAKPSILTGESNSDKPNDMEGDTEYIRFEKAISLRQSPKTTYLDSTQPFGKGNRITFKYGRTLQQIIDSNLYNLSSNFMSYYGSRAKDKRLVDLFIYEHWVMINGSAWKLCYIDGWQEPLAWQKTSYTSLPVSYLCFNKMGDLLYGVSHGTLGLRAQKELNYLNELWKKHIDNMRNQHLVDTSALSETGKKTLQQNDIGGIVGTTKPLASGIAQPLQSAPVDPALFGNIQNVRQYIQLILSTTGGKAGGPEADFATTERNKVLGDTLRSSGIQDSIRDFMINQIKQRIECYLKFGTPDMTIKLTGENLIMPMTGKPIAQGEEVKLGGDNGLTLKDIITGNLDVDYIFDVDIQSASRPDYPVIRKQLGEGMAISLKMAPIVSQENKRIRFDLMLKDFFKTFDTIPDVDKYIEDLTPEEIAMKVQQIAMQQQGITNGVPTEGAIDQGANRVKTGTEGLQ